MEPRRRLLLCTAGVISPVESEKRAEAGIGVHAIIPTAMRNTLSRLLSLSAIVCFALSSAPARAAVSVVNSDNVKTAIFQNTELSQYTYSSNSLVADWKLCKFNENTAYTFTNTINVVITSITFEGVVDNNNDRSQSVTISKGAEALTSQITWNNRKSTSLSSTTIDVSSLSISKDSKALVSTKNLDD